MAGTAASETILFIAAILVTTAVVGALSVVVTGLAGDVESRGELLSSELRTHITIINDPLVVETDPLEIYVKNTGSKSLLTPDINVLIDGQVMASGDVAFDVMESTDDDTLRQGEVLQITVSDQTFNNNEDYRIRIVTDNGIEDTFTFTA